MEIGTDHDGNKIEMNVKKESDAVYRFTVGNHGVYTNIDGILRIIDYIKESISE